MINSDFQYFHIGSIIKHHIQAEEISEERICSYMKCTEKELKEMLKQKDFSTHLLLRWSKLLEYDLFKLYSQYSSLYDPHIGTKRTNDSKNPFPLFRKNLYTKEIIEEYNIPKSTLDKWIVKY